MKKIELSKELLLSPYLNGVELVAPTQENVKHLVSIAALDQYKTTNYLYDKQNYVKYANLANLTLYNIHSERDIINKMLDAVVESWNADLINSNNNAVLFNQRLNVLNEFLSPLKQDICYQAVSMKIPFYQKGNLAGVFGSAFIFNDGYTFAEGLSLMMSLGIYSSRPPELLTPTDSNANTNKLSMREQQCLALLKRGYSAKMIASKLVLSTRTVEFYVENIKNKLGVNSKAELIAM